MARTALILHGGAGARRERNYDAEVVHMRQVVEAMERATGLHVPIEEGPRRPGDPPVLVTSAEKARRELHWAPATPNLTDIASSAWKWHHSHPEGYARADRA